MLTTHDIGLQYGKRILFDEVNLKFTRGNCYGVIGANGSGKSTLLKILTGETAPNRGSVTIGKDIRMAVLKQDHFEFESTEVLKTIIMGHKDLMDIATEKDAIYANSDSTAEDFMRAGDLETLYGEMGGWTADNEASSLLSNMGIAENKHNKLMSELNGQDKVKVLLAQALFGQPDLLLLDEPTNGLDAITVAWFADFLADFPNTVILVSHDRYFLDMVCTHMVDIDFGKIRIFTGNYTFWYESSQLVRHQQEQKNAKTESRQKELMDFIARFSANASKSRQATSRKKALEKLNIDEIRASSRKYPYIHFKPERLPGNQILQVSNLSKSNAQGETVFSNLTFTVNKNDKIALVCRDSSVMTAFFDVLSGKTQADSGTISWGQTIRHEYLGVDIDNFFTGINELNLLDWLRQYSKDKDEQFIRGFLGRMFFSGEEVFKLSSVLSGGEKVRCMLSKIMLNQPNFLLLDEPTNHLDLESVTALNNGLKEFPGAMIFTSHDFQIMNSVSNRVIEIVPGGMVDRLIEYERFIKERERVLSQNPGNIYI
ncbi:MAG: ATP-binding cassette domain-containing protein [Bacteroidota bacterium]